MFNYMFDNTREYNEILQYIFTPSPQTQKFRFWKGGLENNSLQIDEKQCSYCGHGQCTSCAIHPVARSRCQFTTQAKPFSPGPPVTLDQWRGSAGQQNI